MLFIAAYYHPVENLTQQSFVWRCLASCITGKFCSDQSESYQAKCRQMSLLIGLIIVGIAKKNKYICSSESRPLAEGEQAVFLSLFLSAFLPSEILFYFFTQNKGGRPGPLPQIPRSLDPPLIKDLASAIANQIDASCRCINLSENVLQRFNLSAEVLRKSQLLEEM